MSNEAAEDKLISLGLLVETKSWTALGLGDPTTWDSACAAGFYNFGGCINGGGGAGSSRPRSVGAGRRRRR